MRDACCAGVDCASDGYPTVCFVSGGRYGAGSICEQAVLEGALGVVQARGAASSGCAAWLLTAGAQFAARFTHSAHAVQPSHAGLGGLGARSRKFYDTVRAQAGLGEGLWPNCWNAGSGKITMGADGDSFYEYTLKLWLLGGRTDAGLLRAYRNAVGGMHQKLLRRPEECGGRAFLGDWLEAAGSARRHGTPRGEFRPAMGHLTCFAPGMLALGASRGRRRGASRSTRRRRSCSTR